VTCDIQALTQCLDAGNKSGNVTAEFGPGTPVVPFAFDDHLCRVCSERYCAGTDSDRSGDGSQDRDERQCSRDRGDDPGDVTDVVGDPFRTIADRIPDSLEESGGGGTFPRLTQGLGALPSVVLPTVLDVL